MRGQRHDPAALYLRERPGTHCTGGWVGRRVGLNRCGKYVYFFSPLKWCSCLFCHTNAGEILTIFSFITLVKLLTPLLPLCHSSHRFAGSSLSTEIHLIFRLYFSISHTILPSVLSQPSIISPYPCAAQISSRIGFSQNLTRTFPIYFHISCIPTFLWYI